MVISKNPAEAGFFLAHISKYMLCSQRGRWLQSIISLCSKRPQPQYAASVHAAAHNLTMQQA